VFDLPGGLEGDLHSLDENDLPTKFWTGAWFRLLDQFQVKKIRLAYRSQII